MARYCRNRGEKEGPAQVPLNKFEVLRDRVMQKGEGSSKEIVKDRREILREEREKKKITAQKKGQEKKKEKKIDDEKKMESKRKREIDEGQRQPEREIEEEQEIEMQGFSGGEILKGSYPLA